MTTEKENVRRQQACLKACEAIPTDELVAMGDNPVAGVFGRLAAKAIGERNQLCDALENALAWIDAVPSDTQLPAMPGFDRDDVDQLISDIKKGRS